MDGGGSFVPGSMPAFERASRTSRFDEGAGGSDAEEEDDVGQAYFSKRVCMGCMCTVRYVVVAPIGCCVRAACIGGVMWTRRPASHTLSRKTLLTQAIPAGLDMEIALMREERERDKQLKDQ